MATRRIGDADEVETTLLLRQVERELARTANDRNRQFLEGFVVGILRVRGKSLVGRTPPPVPTDLVDLDIGLDGGRHGLAAIIHGHQFDRMGTALVKIGIAPGIFILFHTDTDVRIVRRNCRGIAVNTEIAALLENTRGEERRHHTGNTAHRAEAGIEGQQATSIRAAFVQFFALAGETAGTVFEHIVLVIGEGGAAAGKIDIHPCFQIPGRVAYQPAGGDVAPDGLGGYGRIVIEFDVNDDVVGLYGLDLDRLVPGLAASRHSHLPIAGRSVGRGGEMETVHAVETGVVDQRADGLALRIAQYGRHRVIGRKDAFVKHRDEGDVDVVTGTPDTAFPENKAFLALAGCIAVHVEVAHRNRSSGSQRQVGLVIALAHDDGTRPVIRHLAGEAAARSSRAFADNLVDRVVQRHLGAADRLRREDIGHEHIVFALVRALGNDRQVGDQDVPYAMFEIVVAAEIVIALIVVLVKLGQRIRAAELDAVDRTVFHLHQVGQMQAIGIEVAELRGIGLAQHVVSSTTRAT